MHSSRMHTARSSSRPGEGLHQAPSGSRPPRPGTPLDQVPPGSRPPRTRHPPRGQNHRRL